MVRILWSFRVRREHESEFARVYGPRGEWAQLFAKGKGYRGTELLRDAPETQRYVTVDSWDSLDDLTRFKEQHHDAYAALDRRCETFTEYEELIGNFDVVA
jgi:heme-degrading monooxygenase HmoA